MKDELPLYIGALTMVGVVTNKHQNDKPLLMS